MSEPSVPVTFVGECRGGYGYVDLPAGSWRILDAWGDRALGLAFLTVRAEAPALEPSA